jgi:uncharacterized membrane protein YphA (DoxX/SURF4 family)
MVALGRFLVVVVFIFSGASKLLDINATAQSIATHVSVPSLLAPYLSGLAPFVTQLEAATSLSFPQILAVLAGVVELVGGILIAFNLGARWLAFVLIIFVFATTFHFHDFWNQSGAERLGNFIHALKNLAIIGGLLLIAGIQKSERTIEPEFPQR